MPFFKKKNTESFINGSMDFKQLVDATHFLENHPDAVYILNLEGEIVSYNQKLSLLLGYGGKQLHHQHFNEFITPTEAKRITPLKQRILTDIIHLKTLIEPLAVTELENGLFHYSADYKIRAQSGQIMKVLETSEQLKLDKFFVLS